MSLKSPLSRFAAVAAAAAMPFALPLSGCSKKPPPPTEQVASAEAEPQGIGVNVTLNESQQKLADELAGQVKNGRFPNQALREKDNAPVFLYLAATSDKPEVIMAALQGMARTYSHAKTPRRTEVTDDSYGLVVAAHLASTDPKIRGYAIEASSHAIAGKEPSKPVTEALLKIAGSNAPEDAPARSMALDMLRRIRNFQKDQKITEVFLAALDAPQAYVVSAALFGLRLRATGLLMRNKFLEKSKELMRHADPGVRGRAAEVAGRLASGDETVAIQLEALLADENAFTRSAACSALAHMGDLASVHKIVKLVDDKESNKYDIRGYELPTGRAGVVHHDGSAWSQVRDAAIRSLQRLSAKTDPHFKPERVTSKKVNEGLDKNAKEAKAWYAKVKAKLPKQREASVGAEASPAEGPDKSAARKGAEPSGAARATPKGSAANPAATPRAAPKAAAPKPPAVQPTVPAQ